MNCYSYSFLKKNCLSYNNNCYKTINDNYCNENLKNEIYSLKDEISKLKITNDKLNNQIKFYDIGYTPNEKIYSPNSMNKSYHYNSTQITIEQNDNEKEKLLEKINDLENLLFNVKNILDLGNNLVNLLLENFEKYKKENI